ncbi:MAG: hypothetical protein J6W38_09490, partial [Prevotella sp.]|nr:hypothetical protein [Prevotella sp.]
MSSILKTCRQQWKWFVGTICLTVLFAILFLLVVAPKYERTASVLVKDENGGGGLMSSMMSNMGMLAGMAGLNITSNVENEMQIFASPFLMQEVVTRLGLDTRYEVYKGLMKQELYDETLPIKVTFPNLTEKEGAYMKMDLRKDGTFTLYKFRKNKDKYDGEVQGKVNTVCKTPIGSVSVIATKQFNSCMANES